MAPVRRPSRWRRTTSLVPVGALSTRPARRHATPVVQRDASVGEREPDASSTPCCLPPPGGGAVEGARDCWHRQTAVLRRAKSASSRFMWPRMVHRRGHVKMASNYRRIAYSAKRMSFVEELTWRGLVHQSTDPELAAKMRAEVVHPLRRLRSDSRFAARRASFAAIGAGACAAGRAQADRARRRRHGHDRRPELQGRRAQAAVAGGLEQNLAGLRKQLGHFLDFSASGGAQLVDNYDWFAAVALPRLSARYRQALQRQHDARQGVGASAPRRSRARDFLHRVFVHARAVLRLPRAARSPRMHACRSAAAISGATSRQGSISSAACAAPRRLE